MRAIRPKRAGGTEVLKLTEFPTPTPGPREALVRVEVAGVNFLDIHFRRGDFEVEPPLMLGVEGAGVVEAVGDDVTDVSVGMRVAWAGCTGSYATHLVAKARKLVPIPDGIDTRTAGAAIMQGMTAHYLTRKAFRLKRDDFAVVYAATGGVGSLLCQMAKQAGATVIAFVSTPAKVKLAKEAGLEHVFFYEAKDLVKRVRSISGLGPHVVYDSVGKDTFATSLQLLRKRGTCVVYGRSSGPVAPFNVAELAKKSLYLTRPVLAHFTSNRKELLFRANAVFDAIKAGTLKVKITASFPLAAASIAHTKLASRETTGKLVLLP
jgi:NADPH:quinone reductase